MSATLLEEAVPYYCVGCGQAVIRELLHEGSMTWHRQPLSPYCHEANSDEDNPQ